jgi:GNAT superfamily N-acetyltransferase
MNFDGATIAGFARRGDHVIASHKLRRNEIIAWCPEPDAFNNWGRGRSLAVFIVMHFTLRKAQLEDVPALTALIGESARGLREGYSSDQVEAALGTVLGVDTQLIRDGTYFVAESGGRIVGCGGWSNRNTLFGSDHGPVKNDAWLDPAVDAARIRAFFVHPAWARQGIGSAILQACEEAAAAEGFSRLELAATLPGVLLYQARGFEPAERFAAPLPNGSSLPIVRMVKTLPPDRARSQALHGDN